MSGMYYLRLFESQISATYLARRPNPLPTQTGAAPRFDVAKYVSQAIAPVANVLGAAAHYLGLPYEMGGGRGAGATPTIDCSAFVSRAYADATGGRIKLTPYTDTMYQET